MVRKHNPQPTTHRIVRYALWPILLALACGCGKEESNPCGNGVLDPGEECDPGTGYEASCVNPCGVDGTGTCLSNCTISQCCAPRETCGNACDDDCDEEIEYTQLIGDVKVSQDLESSRNPSLVFSGSQFAVAWNSGGAVQFARLDPDGSIVGGPASISNGREPSLVFTGSEFAVAWEDGRETSPDLNYEIYFTRLGLDGAPLMPDARITNEPEDSRNPSMVFTGSEFGIAWVDTRYVRAYVFFTRLTPQGVKQGGDTSITISVSVDCQNPSLVFSGSEFAAAWHGIHELVSPGIEFIRVSLEGNPIGQETQIGEYVSTTASPVLAFTGSGYGLAWEDNRLKFARIGLDGTSLSQYQEISQDGKTPSLVFADSHYAVAWSEGDDLNFETLTLEGQAEGSPLQVGQLPGNAFSPSLAYTGTSFGLAWVQYNGTIEEVYFTIVGPCV